MSTTTVLLIAIAIMMLVAIPVAALLKDFLPRFVERSSNIDQLQNRIYVLHSQAQELQDRVNNLTGHRNRRSSEQRRLESDIRKMEKAIADVANQPPVFVHEVGNPQSGMNRFTVNLTQERASSQARNSGERAPVNAIWRYPNVAEVWASSFEEAKQLVETAFPFKLGFTKSFANKPTDGERLAEAARRALQKEMEADAAVEGTRS